MTNGQKPENKGHKISSTALLYMVVAVLVAHGKILPITNVRKTHQQPPNKTLHPTAYSFARRSSSLRFRRRVSLVVGLVRAAWLET
jgi:HKD family nuclease